MDFATATTIIAICASLITIIWFVRDVRKQNSKILKEMSLILREIEQGQREAAEGQRNSQVAIAKILERIEFNTRPT